MKEIKVDVAVIGSGTAGMVAYRKAKENAEDVVLIEGGDYGTTCARVGCMPSKLLISAAEAAHAIEEAPGFGISPKGETIIDGVKVMERVRSERDRFVGFVLDTVDAIPSENKITGYARFVDDQTLQVDDHTKIEAASIVIATGSSPAILPMFEPAGDRLIVNDDVFYWQDLPESVVIFGAGIIGLEIGQALHRLGVRTKILSKFGLVGPLNHPEIIEYADKTFQDEFYIDTDADTLDVKKVGDQVVITYKNLDGDEVSENFDYLLAATGRTPNVKNLGLENTSLELDKRGIPIFDRYTLQCGSSSIFITGDANNDVPLLHEAADEGRIAGENAGTFPEVHAGQRTSPITVVFTDPQIALVGSSYNQLKETPNKCFVTGKVSFENQGRSRVMLKNKGMLYIYAEYGSGIFLGAEMFGPRAEHIAHLLAWAHQKRMCIPEMLQMPFYHPVIEEGVRTALRDANEKLHIGPGLDETSIECGPGI
ncbi:MAG: dihydrolipoyl dehydrogenase [Thermodesulfobacteriota bacterium]|nr:MAG: dihydrolipoyl dehydrogenase [Thermodesulfobacteriota bacterium]